MHRPISTHTRTLLEGRTPVNSHDQHDRRHSPVKKSVDFSEFRDMSSYANIGRVFEAISLATSQGSFVGKNAGNDDGVVRREETVRSE